MSNRLLSLVWDIEMPPGSKLVAAVLADMADDKTSTCWPSVQTIGSKTGQCERTVQACLRDLVRRKIIKAKPRSGTSTVFEFTPAKSAPQQELPPADTAPTPPIGCTPPPQILPPTPAKSAPRTLKNPQLTQREVRGTRLALAALPEDWRKAGVEIMPLMNPEEVFAKFRDHWAAQPGTKGRKSDWLATWRNWVRNERDRYRPNAPPKSASNGNGLGWLMSEAGTMAKGQELGMQARPGESMDEYRDRLRHANGRAR